MVTQKLPFWCRAYYAAVAMLLDMALIFNRPMLCQCMTHWLPNDNSIMYIQVLTLASNERVPLTNSMRLMFEIGHLKTATPATVSRAGILFVNPSDLGWNPYVCLSVPIWVYTFV